MEGRGERWEGEVAPGLRRGAGPLLDGWGSLECPAACWGDHSGDFGCHLKLRLCPHPLVTVRRYHWSATTEDHPLCPRLPCAIKEGGNAHCVVDLVDHSVPRRRTRDDRDILQAVPPQRNAGRHDQDGSTVHKVLERMGVRRRGDDDGVIDRIGCSLYVCGG